MTQKEIWDNWKAPDTLEECVSLFFEILDSKESSDMNPDVLFHPTKFNAKDKAIDSCRVWDTHRLNKLLPKMKELSRREVNLPTTP